VDGNEAYEEGKGKGKGKSPLGSFKGWELPRLDSMLGQWDGVGIVEISGPRRVGKSVSIPNWTPRGMPNGQLLALHAVLRTLISESTATCHWLDTEGSFAPDRAKSALETLGVIVCFTSHIHSR